MVLERFVDVFQERAPKTVIAKHSTRKGLEYMIKQISQFQTSITRGFCGKESKSILVIHHTDFSPTKLKEIHEKTDAKSFTNHVISILSERIYNRGFCNCLGKDSLWRVTHMIGWRDYISLQKWGNNHIEIWDIIPGSIYTSGTESKLVLTDQRLVVMEPEIESSGLLGLVKKAKYWKLEQTIPLEAIKGVFAEQGEDNGMSEADLQILTDDTKHSFRRVDTGDQISTKYLEQVMDRKLDLERKKTQVAIDFSFLGCYMEKGGMVLTALKCPECNAPIEMPQNGTETVCSYCKSTIYAQNIFEKVRKLTE
jgi:DNA-directed RNA polymerase subunit RPC12/RpoP